MTDIMLPKRDNKPGLKREVFPKIVQLGTSLPSRKPDITDIWVPVDPGNKILTSEEDPRSKPSTPRYSKYRNLYEYSRRHKGKCQLEKSLWKNPNLSNNLLPLDKAVVPSQKRDTGIYDAKYRDLFNKLVQENTFSLPAISNPKNKQEIPAILHMNETQYIISQTKSAGPLKMFARDAVHLPSVYSQCYTCRDCRRSYISDVYNQTSHARNSSVPPDHADKIAEGRIMTSQHCDVLGERYCRACIETRTKRFSRNIEGGLTTTRELGRIHYRSSR